MVQNEVKDTLQQRHHSMAHVWTDAASGAAISGSGTESLQLGAARNRSSSMYPGGSPSSLLSPGGAYSTTQQQQPFRRSLSREYSPSPYRVSFSSASDETRGWFQKMIE